MTTEIINYNELIDDAMHGVVKQSLYYVRNNKLPGDHHFYITFFTKHQGVSISSKLKLKYPEEMTIVLQHEFRNLVVAEDSFSVTLIFAGAEERITVPYRAITAFADPSVKFGLQFRHEIEKIPVTNTESQTKEKKNKDDDNIMKLDKFRKNNN